MQSRQKPGTNVFLLIGMYCFVAIMISVYIKSIYQYDETGTIYYKTVAILGSALFLAVSVVCARDFAQGLIGRLCVGIPFAVMATFGSYLLDLPDLMLGILPGFKLEQIATQNVPVLSLVTTKARGRFRHFVIFGSNRPGFSASKFRLDGRTYNELMISEFDALPDPHVGTVAMKDLCYTASVKLARYVQVIEISSGWPEISSFHRC